MKLLLFIGPFCPPVTGQTFMTDVIYEKLKNNPVARVVKINIVRGNTDSKLLNTCIRLYRIFKCIYNITKYQNIKYKKAYLSVDANAGMYITFLLSLICRLFRYEIILHHHSYSHLISRKLPMSMLSKAIKACSVHINICEIMSKRMKELYPHVLNTINLSNAIALPKKSSHLTDTYRSNSSFNIGFLGKICNEKGVHEAIQVFTNLFEQGEDVHLILAGPVASTEIMNTINGLSDKYGRDKVDYLGPVYDLDKENFYNSIDVFLFPTKYLNETQGIVNIEAMSYGVPVVAFGRCCVISDVGKSGGLVVPVNGNFADKASAYIKEMISSRDVYISRRLGAFEQFSKIKQQSDVEYDEFTQLVLSR